MFLVFNAGSSTIKLGIYTDYGERTATGHVDLRRTPLTLRFNSEDHSLDATVTDDLRDVVGALLTFLKQTYGDDAFVAAGHRIVHGGSQFTDAAWFDNDVMRALTKLEPLAPLHQPAGLNLVRAVAAFDGDIRQLACFDTAFHTTQLPHATRMAIPHELHDEGVRRYGFHGLSYQSIAENLLTHEPDIARQRWVVAHLGSGASLCALNDAKSRDTSMGFSALDGIPMATRPGELDAGVPLYLQQQRGMGVDELQTWLYHECGLKGVSGISADARVLAESDDPRAVETLDYFAFRIARQIAALASSLGGLDGVVFTAGIGENQPALRANVAQRLAWLGASLDSCANDRNDRIINAPGSRLHLRVIATDEERVIADALRGKLTETPT